MSLWWNHHHRREWQQLQRPGTCAYLWSVYRTIYDNALCHCWDCKQTSGTAFSSNIVVPVKDLKIEGPTKEFKIKVPSGNVGAYSLTILCTFRNPNLLFICIAATRVFCGNCGSAICHFSPALGEAKAVQTGNFKHFADKPVALESKCPGPPLSVFNLVGWTPW